MDDFYDVAVLGGGPAGSATALALKQRDPALRVALIEKTGYSALRVGESLPPPARALLTKLGVWEAFVRSSPLNSYGTRAGWGSPELHDNEFIFSAYGNGWHVDRRQFDALLAEQASRAGVELFLHSRARMQGRAQDHWMLTLENDGGNCREVRARFMVDATGRRSSFASTQGARHIVYDQLAGVFVFFRFPSVDSVPDTYTSVEACEDGWWYTAMLPDGHMAVAFMTDADVLRKLPWQTLEEWLSLPGPAPHTRGRFKGGTPVAGPSLYSASSQRLASFASDGWLAVGDAAGVFDPLSSQGIVKALRSGIHAAMAIVRHFGGDQRALDGYSAAVAREYNHYLDGRAAYYALERRWPDAPFWQRRRQVITLDPNQPLHFSTQELPKREFARMATRLASEQVQLLAEICAVPRPASEVVTEFHLRTRHVYPDRNVVLTLQDLVTAGVLLPTPISQKRIQGGVC